MEKIRIAIVGYGNVGKGVHRAIERNPDMELEVIISRDSVRVYRELAESEIIPPTVISDKTEGLFSQSLADVAILCGGSAKDLPEQGPFFAKYFNTIDSFDNHKEISNYFWQMHAFSSTNNHVSIISAGWDPGTFSVNRVLAEAFIPGAKPRGFYGLSENGGLSMGHSDAIRTIKGVQDARQYTHAINAAIGEVRSGKNPDLTSGGMHWRECFVVLKKDTRKERQRVDREIKEMPNYFKPYHTEVNFVSQGELEQRYSGMPHDGLVLAVGETGEGNRALIEYRNEWASNPQATGSILVACARANYRMQKEGKKGAFTMLDIPPAYFSSHSKAELLKDFM